MSVSTNYVSTEVVITFSSDADQKVCRKRNKIVMQSGDIFSLKDARLRSIHVILTCRAWSDVVNDVLDLWFLLLGFTVDLQR